jgi:hypothetical protein
MDWKTVPQKYLIFGAIVVIAILIFVFGGDSIPEVPSVE